MQSCWQYRVTGDQLHDEETRRYELMSIVEVCWPCNVVINVLKVDKTCWHCDKKNLSMMAIIQQQQSDSLTDHTVIIMNRKLCDMHVQQKGMGFVYLCVKIEKCACIAQCRNIRQSLYPNYRSDFTQNLVSNYFDDGPQWKAETPHVSTLFIQFPLKNVLLFFCAFVGRVFLYMPTSV